MAMTLDRKDCALIVVDMQNGFLEEKGSMARLGFPYQRLREAIPGCQRLIAAARKAGIPVFFTQYVYQSDFKDGGVLMDEIMPALKDVRLCAKGTWDADLAEGFKPYADETVIEKNRPSAFYSTQLDSILRAMRIENLVICGVTSNMCVETTVRDASQRDFRTFVAADAIAEVEEDRHRIALKTMGNFFGAALTVNEILDSWKVELQNVV
ncbi:MAG: cysteine hydrolase [Alphaproteobacteria bacterium]|nr:cysteine hydrolase [Alphaproteobacteria bacterium]